MRKVSVFLYLILTVSILTGAGAFGQEKDVLLDDIVSDIEKYRNVTLTLTLKLKYRDNLFHKIVFYDRKNRDIEFDISSRELREKLKEELLNLHGGMEYRVDFTVIKIGNLGGIIAELKGFKPVILEKVP